MNWLDFVFIGIISLSVIISIFRGLIKEVFSLLIWMGAFWVAYQFVDVAAVALENWIELASARHLIAFVMLFISALIIGGMINFIIGKLIKSTGLSGTDRFFGMFFGALRGLIVIIVITFFIQATPLSEDPWWQQSKMAPQFSKISEWVRSKMPDDFSNYFSFIETQRDSKGSQSVQDQIKDMATELMNKNNNEDKHPQQHEINESTEEH